MLLKPASDVEHFGDVVAGAAADAVRLFRNADKNGFNVEKFESFVELLGFGDGGTVIGFAALHSGDRSSGPRR